MPLTAAQRVELAVPAAIAWTVARSIHRGSKLSFAGEERAKRIAELLQRASHEPLADLHGKDRDKLVRRVERVTRAVTEPLVDQPVTICMWALFETLRVLIDAGLLEMVEGGAFDLGWSDLQTWCFEDNRGDADPDTANDEIEAARNRVAMDRSEAQGRRAGHRLLHDLQSHGLFRNLSVRFGAAA